MMPCPPAMMVPMRMGAMPMRTADDLLIEGANVVDRHIGVELGDGLLDGGGDLQRVHSGAHNDGDVVLEVLRQRIKDQRAIRIGHRIVAHLIDHADDLHRVSLEYQALPDIIAIGPKLLGKRSIDDDYAWRGLIVVRGKIAARKNACAQGCKIGMIDRRTNNASETSGSRLGFDPRAKRRRADRLQYRRADAWRGWRW